MICLYKLVLRAPLITGATQGRTAETRMNKGRVTPSHIGHLFSTYTRARARRGFLLHSTLYNFQNQYDDVRRKTNLVFIRVLDVLPFVIPFKG